LTEPRAGERLQALGVLLTGACVIAFSPILVRLTQTGPAAAAVWRLAFALPILGVLAGRADGGIRPPSRLALVAGVMFALDLGFWHYGIKYTSVGLATALSNMTPVVVTAFAWIFLKQRPRRLFLAAVVVAVGGAWLMASARRGAAGLDPPLGNAFSAATALWYALYMLAIGQARRRESATALMFWSTLAGLPLVLIAAWLLGERIAPASASGWLACAGLGVVHVAGQGAIAWAMGRLPAALASVVVLVQPVVAGLLAWLIFGEGVTGVQALGGAIALGGVVLAQRASRPPARPMASSTPSVA
jgi:drug/metabolite transporter (DMT)-like permease